MQDDAERKQSQSGARKNHAVLKQAHAALGAMLQLLFPQQPPISEFAHIKSIAQTLRVTAPNLPKYSETISLDPFFNTLVQAARQGAVLWDIPIKTLRDWTILLL